MLHVVMLNIFSKLKQMQTFLPFCSVFFFCFFLLYLFLQNSPMRPSPQTHPANQQTTHSQPSHTQMMSGQVRLTVKPQKQERLNVACFFLHFFFSFFFLKLILRRNLNVLFFLLTQQPFMGAPRYPSGPRPGARMPQGLGNDFNGVSEP